MPNSIAVISLSPADGRAAGQRIARNNVPPLSWREFPSREGLVDEAVLRWRRGYPGSVPQPGPRLHHLLAGLRMVAGLGGAGSSEGQSEARPRLHRLLARDPRCRYGDGLHASDRPDAGGIAASWRRVAARLRRDPLGTARRGADGRPVGRIHDIWRGPKARYR